MPYSSSESSNGFGKTKNVVVGSDSELSTTGKATKLIIPSFNILITGGTSGLVETITDAVSIHSIKKAEYARRLAEGTFRHVTLLDHFKSVSFSPV